MTVNNKGVNYSAGALQQTLIKLLEPMRSKAYYCLSGRLTSIHRAAEKKRSRKLIFKILYLYAHSPGPNGVYAPPRIQRVYNILWVRINIRKLPYTRPGLWPTLPRYDAYQWG
jgi:hypothetical protein